MDKKLEQLIEKAGNSEGARKGWLHRQRRQAALDKPYGQNYEAGTVVEHPTYGRGIISYKEPGTNQISVNFDNPVQQMLGAAPLRAYNVTRVKPIKDYSISHIVGNYHVSTPDDEIVKDFNERAKNHPPSMRKLIVDEALREHHANQKLYHGVMTGNLTGKAATGRKKGAQPGNDNAARDHVDAQYPDISAQEAVDNWHKAAGHNRKISKAPEGEYFSKQNGMQFTLRNEQDPIYNARAVYVIPTGEHIGTVSHSWNATGDDWHAVPKDESGEETSHHKNIDDALTHLMGTATRTRFKKTDKSKAKKKKEEPTDFDSDAYEFEAKSNYNGLRPQPLFDQNENLIGVMKSYRPVDASDATQDIVHSFYPDMSGFQSQHRVYLSVESKPELFDNQVDVMRMLIKSGVRNDLSDLETLYYTKFAVMPMQTLKARHRGITLSLNDIFDNTEFTAIHKSYTASYLDD